MTQIHSIMDRAADLKPGQPRPQGQGSSVAWFLGLVVLAAVFYRASRAPVWHLDTWGHWKYGQWILENGRLPDREPFTIYSDHDRHLTDLWWLSQLLCYAAYRGGGMEAVSLLYALVEVAKSALYLAAFRRVGGSLALALAGLVVLHLGRWNHFGNFRPQAIGEVCWAALLLVCVPPGRWTPWVAPPCVALWANLHGGVLLAFALLGVLLLGSLFDRPGPGSHEPSCMRLSWTLGLCLVATFCTPQGPGYLAEVVRLARTPTLEAVEEWQPLTPLRGYSSWVLVVSVLVVLWCVRASPRRFTVAETFLLLVFGLAAWFSSRLVPFWLTVCILTLTPRARSLLDRAVIGSGNSARKLAESSPSRFCWILAGSLVAVAVVMLSPSGLWILRHTSRPPGEQVTAVTPIALADDLRCGAGQASGARVPLRLFCSALWSDYLLWSLPAGDQVYWYSHWHCFSLRRLGDGNRLALLHPASRTRPANDWHALLDRYRFNTLAVRNEDRSRPLFKFLVRATDDPGSEWEVTLYPRENGSHSVGEPFGLVARRRLDPVVLGLANAQGVQACVTANGWVPLAGTWSFLTHLPWYWSE